jgi:UDP-N-acetylglucosamine transferase subunit ALG13
MVQQIQIRKMEKIMETYFNRDFYLSSYLVAAGMQLRSFRKTNGITTFEFDNSEKLQDLVQDYYSMNAFVNAMQYGSAIKNLKSVIHSDTNTKSNYNYERSTLCSSK